MAGRAVAAGRRGQLVWLQRDQRPCDRRGGRPRRRSPRGGIRAAAPPAHPIGQNPRGAARKRPGRYAETMAASVPRWPTWRTSPTPAEPTSPTARRSRRDQRPEAVTRASRRGDRRCGRQALIGQRRFGAAPEVAVPFHRPGIAVRRHGSASSTSPSPRFAAPSTMCCDCLPTIWMQPLCPPPFRPRRLDLAAWPRPPTPSRPSSRVEYALAELWASWGIEPAAVLGHSVGEYVAACRAGVFSLADGLRLIAAQGRLTQALPGEGMMAAVLVSCRKSDPGAAPYAGQVAVAAYNGPEEVVIGRAGRSGAAGARRAGCQGNHELAARRPARQPLTRTSSPCWTSLPGSPPRSNTQSRGCHLSPIRPASSWAQARFLTQRIGFATRGRQSVSPTESRRSRSGATGCSSRSARRRLCAVWARAAFRSGRRNGCRRCGEAARTGRLCSGAWRALYRRGVRVDWKGFDRDYPRAGRDTAGLSLRARSASGSRLRQLQTSIKVRPLAGRPQSPPAGAGEPGSNRLECAHVPGQARRPRSAFDGLHHRALRSFGAFTSAGQALRLGRLREPFGGPSDLSGAHGTLAAPARRARAAWKS